MTGALALRPLLAVESDELRDSRHPDAKAARDQADWLSWLELGGTAARTLHDYQWATDHLLARYKGKRFDEFTDGDLLRVLKAFPEGSRRVRKAAFTSWFKWGVRTRRLERNPVDLLPEIRRTPQRLIRVFTEPQEALLRSLPSPDGPLMTVLFETGLRKAEARHIQMRHFDRAAGRVYIMAGAKGGKHRAVPIGPALADALEQMELLEAVGQDDFLWYHRPGGGRVQRGRPVGEGTFHRWWDRCLAECGFRRGDREMPYLKPHTTRHTFATRWRTRGLDLDEIQMLLGHDSVQTTEMYVHREVDDIAVKMLTLRGH